MKPGDPVEVNAIWAGGALETLRHWFKGYEFVEARGSLVRVKILKGVFAGEILNCDAHAVRPEAR